MGLATAAVGLKQAIDPPKTQGAAGQQTSQALAEWAQQLSEGIADPNSQLFKNLAAEEEEVANLQFTEGLKRFFIENARARARGGRGAISVPERRDEMFANAIAGQRERATGEARSRARAALQNAASAAGFGVGAAQASGQLGAANQLGEDNRLAGALGQIGAGIESAEKAVPAFEALFGNTAVDPKTSSVPGAGINNPHTD